MNDVKRMLAELIAERKYEAPKSDIAALLPRSNYPVTSPVRPAEEIFTDTEEVIDEPPHEEMTRKKPSAKRSSARCVTTAASAGTRPASFSYPKERCTEK